MSETQLFNLTVLGLHKQISCWENRCITPHFNRDIDTIKARKYFTVPKVNCFFFTCWPPLMHRLCLLSMILITYLLSFLFLVLHCSFWIIWSNLSPLGYCSGVSFTGLSSACRHSLPHFVTALFSLVTFTDYIPILLSVLICAWNLH